jgi:hypothetical protein
VLAAGASLALLDGRSGFKFQLAKNFHLRRDIINIEGREREGFGKRNDRWIVFDKG